MTRVTYPAGASVDPTRGLLDAMTRAGVVPVEPIAGALNGGGLVRFRAEGDKPGRRNGWAVLRDGGGAFGHWRLDVAEGWRADRPSAGLSRIERDRLRRELTVAKARERAARAVRHIEAAGAALALWRGAEGDCGAHPYLVAKRLGPAGFRRVGAALLVPMRDPFTGELWNVQRIAPDGGKRFQPGARVAGLAWGLGEPGPTLALCEGAATAAAVHAATGLCTLAAMTKANLGAVAAAMRRRWPSARLIIGADLDADGGGERAALEAVAAVGGLVALPPVPDGWTGPAWDYADLWTAGEPGPVRAAFGIGERA